MTITYGECGHPLREGKRAVQVLAVEDGWCRVCDLIESRVDGEGVLRHPPSSEWRGRGDEANAYRFQMTLAEAHAVCTQVGIKYTSVSEPLQAIFNLGGTLDSNVRFIEGGLGRALGVEVNVAAETAQAFIDCVCEIRRLRGHAGEFTTIGDVDVGRTSRDVPAWNERREVVPMNRARIVFSDASGFVRGESYEIVFGDGRTEIVQID